MVNRLITVALCLMLLTACDLAGGTLIVNPVGENKQCVVSRYVSQSFWYNTTTGDLELNDFILPAGDPTWTLGLEPPPFRFVQEISLTVQGIGSKTNRPRYGSLMTVYAFDSESGSAVLSKASVDDIDSENFFEPHEIAIRDLELEVDVSNYKYRVSLQSSPDPGDPTIAVLGSPTLLSDCH